MGMIKIPTAAIAKFEQNYPDIFASGILAEGDWNKKLSSFVKTYAKAKFALPFSANGAGLLAILMLLKKYRGFKKVFIQSNTMYGVKTIAITSGLDFIGCVPCSFPYLMPTAKQLEQFITSIKDPKKSIFLMSHIGGIVNPEINRIAQICKESGIALIEDCAHSYGATLDDIHTGTFGLAGVYSLYSTKAIPAGEGGIAVSNDEELGYLLSKFQIYDRFDQKQEIGVNFRISELQALFSLCMCEQSELIIDNKALIADRYIHACKTADIEFIDPFSNGQRGNNYKFTIIAKKDAKKEFSNITNRTSPVYDYSLGLDPFNIHLNHVCLPIWFELEESIIEKTVAQVMAVPR